MPKPTNGSIITLTAPVLDEYGDALTVGLDVVVLEAHNDGSILVSAENEAEQEVSAWVHEGEWEQRPEEVRSIEEPLTLPAEDVVALFRRVLAGELTLVLLDDVDFQTAYVNSALFAVDAPEGRWLLSVFNDCAEVDYVEVAVAPDGRSGEFDLWWDVVENDPVGLLSEVEAAHLEAIVFALPPAGRPRCPRCGGFGQLERVGISFHCGHAEGAAS